MNARIVGLLLCVGSFGIAVAGEASPYEKALQQTLDSFNKIGAKLITIIDEESAASAKPDLRKAADGFLQARAKAEKLPPPEKEEKARLEKMFKSKLDESMKKLAVEIRRVESVRGGNDALKEIAGVLKKESK